jgi:hypothetical protein
LSTSFVFARASAASFASTPADVSSAQRYSALSDDDARADALISSLFLKSNAASWPDHATSSRVFASAASTRHAALPAQSGASSVTPSRPSPFFNSGTRRPTTSSHVALMLKTRFENRCAIVRYIHHGSAARADGA